MFPVYMFLIGVREPQRQWQTIAGCWKIVTKYKYRDLFKILLDYCNNYFTKNVLDYRYSYVYKFVIDYCYNYFWKKVIEYLSYYL
jgi:hypothetical protein